MSSPQVLIVIPAISQCHPREFSMSSREFSMSSPRVLNVIPRVLNVIPAQAGIHPFIPNLQSELWI
jgi:hypothetical protein